MTGSDTEAQRKRAAELRKEIGRLTGASPTGANAEADQTPSKESPRSLIEKRMRELDKKARN